eukprot:Opistho-2@29488
MEAIRRAVGVARRLRAQYSLRRLSRVGRRRLAIVAVIAVVGYMADLPAILLGDMLAPILILAGVAGVAAIAFAYVQRLKASKASALPMYAGSVLLTSPTPSGALEGLGSVSIDLTSAYPAYGDETHGQPNTHLPLAPPPASDPYCATPYEQVHYTGGTFHAHPSYGMPPHSNLQHLVHPNTHQGAPAASSP